VIIHAMAVAVAVAVGVVVTVGVIVMATSQTLFLQSWLALFQCSH
jgi:hypothetical protein